MIINEKAGLLFTVLWICCSNQTLAENKHGLNSDEIKNVRHISRAILKSRANEKKHIEDELVGQRKDLAQMKQVVEALETEIRKMMLVPPRLNISPRVKNMTSSLDNSKEGKKSIQTKPQVILATGFKEKTSARLKDTSSRLMSLRQGLEKNQPAWWQFWKKKDQQHMRASKIADVSKKVEAKLNALVDADKVELKEIQKLKQMLELKRQEINIKDMDPTIHTRTK